MSFLDRLFGAPEAATEAVKAVRDGFDALVYTSEEKAHDGAADRSEARQVLLEWIRNSQGQNLARRVLAFLIAGSWLLFKLLASLLSVAAIWSPADIAKNLIESSNSVADFSSDMTPAVMLILGFYFAAPHMSSIAKAALVRFGEKNSK